MVANMENISEEDHPTEMNFYQKSQENYIDFYKILELEKGIIPISIGMFSF